MHGLGLMVFVFGICGCLYIVVGYPFILSAMANRHPQPVTKSFVPRRVTVILPVRNGEPWISRKLRSILDLNYPRHLMEILVVSDGSKDRTESIAAGFQSEGVTLLRNQHDGKAAALNTAMERATGDVFFLTDVRQPLHPDCLRRLMECLGDPHVGAACGQLQFISGENLPHVGLYWRYERWLRRNLSRYDSLLAGTCTYVIHRDLATRIPPGTLLDDSWLPLSAFLQGYRFVLEENAITYEYPNSLESEFLRKVRTLAGIYQIIKRCPALLTTSNRMRWHFISYRLGRLAMPFLLIMTIAGSIALPEPYKRVALSAWSAILALAILDIVIPVGVAGKRVTSVVRSFVLLMLASLCALSIAFVPPSTLWADTWKQKG